MIPLAHRIATVARLLSVSERTIRREIAARRLKAVMLRGVLVVPAAELEAYLRRCPSAVPPVLPKRRAHDGKIASLETARAYRETARRMS